MKKLILTTAIVATFLSSSAFAKTEGSYFGIDLLRTKTNAEITRTNTALTSSNSNTTDSKMGFGIDYKYAININNFFVAPGLIYESLGTENKHSYSEDLSFITPGDYYRTAQSLKIKDRMGVKIDLGYDITDKFAAYVPVGYARTRYEFSANREQLLASSYSSTTVKKTGSQGALFYGVGFLFHPTKEVSLSLEYNRSKFDLSAGVDTYSFKSKAKIDVMKLGVAYHF